MEPEFIANTSFFLFFSVIVLCVSYTLSLFINLILDSKKTIYLAVFLTILYFGINLGPKLSSLTSQTEHLYLSYVTAITLAISLGVILGIQTRKTVAGYAKKLEKKPSKCSTVKIIFILITLIALLYDIYYLSTPHRKSTLSQSIIIQILR